MTHHVMCHKAPCTAAADAFNLPALHHIHHAAAIAGLNEEHQQARHWVANHLEFKDGSKVQFFEVNIRILGGLLSAYYLSGGDDMYLQKAEMLADRCVHMSGTAVHAPRLQERYAWYRTTATQQCDWMCNACG